MKASRQIHCPSSLSEALILDNTPWTIVLVKFTLVSTSPPTFLRLQLYLGSTAFPLCLILLLKIFKLLAKSSVLSSFDIFAASGNVKLFLQILSSLSFLDLYISAFPIGWFHLSLILLSFHLLIIHWCTLHSMVLTNNSTQLILKLQVPVPVSPIHSRL